MKATLNSREENIAKLTVDFTAKEWEDGSDAYAGFNRYYGLFTA